ncbi:glycosyl transferase [Pedobacter sp. HMF7647]|uniref:Glycosyl transferase n=1 Tax=Hufsiella arboris TaxID=2695275 RepID=A0A7K1Y6G1_9SPHI|nr:glycoside hydrolase family 9 protein [Hufsiella arboris]MXV50162.1 glycosyl transferase [Hufsiella arboris]
MKLKLLIILTGCLLSFFCCFAQPVIYVNQVAFDSRLPKIAVIGTDEALNTKTRFEIIDAIADKPVFGAVASGPFQVADWFPGRYFYTADFSAFQKPGTYKVRISIVGKSYTSEPFSVGEKALARQTLPAILNYYHKQRANTKEELEADSHVRLFGSDKTVDLRGGWCDASGDISKYFSHLAYANYMSPQQIPLVTWAMVKASQEMPALLKSSAIQDSLESEALYGADYLMRSLSDEGYFYMIVFSYFNKDPNARRVVGLLANSVTTADYQAAFREGGGMAIAALARASRLKRHGKYTSAQYLAGAKKAFNHLQKNNTRYDDDGKENIIDDYCALLAASELWIATGGVMYRQEARKRANQLLRRLDNRGFFIANNSGRPFWHASDAGLPVIALVRYLDKETDPVYRKKVVDAITSNLKYQLTVTSNTANPFGYARQTISVGGKLSDGFFIPHENETGWWWQGENARLGSLAAAALAGQKLITGRKADNGLSDSLSVFACQQLSWILGCNPYSMCFMYGFGKNNVPYMHSSFGHGSEKGGISNGITGKDGIADGSGIDFKKEAEGNEWRWTEQWLPHAAWFLIALTNMNQ